MLKRIFAQPTISLFSSLVFLACGLLTSEAKSMDCNACGITLSAAGCAIVCAIADGECSMACLDCLNSGGNGAGGLCPGCQFNPEQCRARGGWKAQP